MRVLVTGGTGYLGSAIVRGLRDAGHEPVVFARRAASRPRVSIAATFATHAPSPRAAEAADAICHLGRAGRASGGAIRRSSTPSTSAGLQSVLAAARDAADRRESSTPRRFWRCRRPTARTR